MGINMQRNKQTWNITDLTNYSNIKDASTFGSALQQIDNKLNDIKKEITYWDVYNISSAVYNEEEFENKVANLNVNSSLVINTTSFNATFNGENTDFHSGDIIIRLKDGSHQHIKAANAGVYVPKLDVNGTKDQLTITYEYQTTVSEGDKKEAIIKTLTGTNSKMYGYSLMIDNTDENKTYNSSKPFRFKIEVDETTGIFITPIIKFFDIKRQEIYTDEYTLAIDDNDNSKFKFYLRNNTSGIIKNVVIK